MTRPQTKDPLPDSVIEILDLPFNGKLFSATSTEYAIRTNCMIVDKIPHLQLMSGCDGREIVNPTEDFRGRKGDIHIY